MSDPARLTPYVCVSRQYMVAIPAVLESADMTKVCASLLQPNETLLMTVRLISNGNNASIFRMISNGDFHTCAEFEVSWRDWYRETKVAVVQTDKILCRCV